MGSYQHTCTVIWQHAWLLHQKPLQPLRNHGYYWVELKIKSYTVKTLGSVTICDGLIKHIWNTIIIQKLKSMDVGWSNIEH
jgi:hypothetical protein